MPDPVFRRLFERQAGVDNGFRLRHGTLQPFDPSRTIHCQFDARSGLLVADQLGQPGLIDLLTGLQSIHIVRFLLTELALANRRSAWGRGYCPRTGMAGKTPTLILFGLRWTVFSPILSI